MGGGDDGPGQDQAPTTTSAGSPYQSQYRAAQEVVNESWPLRDRRGRHAHGIPDQARPIAVEVRLVLSDDGELWLAGSAQRWTATHVYVTGLRDERLRISSVWVRAGDVRRALET